MSTTVSHLQFIALYSYIALCLISYSFLTIGRGVWICNRWTSLVESLSSRLAWITLVVDYSIDELTISFLSIESILTLRGYSEFIFLLSGNITVLYQRMLMVKNCSQLITISLNLSRWPIIWYNNQPLFSICKSC